MAADPIKRVLLIPGILICSLVLALSGCSSDSEPEGAGEVFLEAAEDPGPDPFTSSVDALKDEVTTPGVDKEPTQTAAPSSDAGDITSVTATQGTETGLYGGSGDRQICDRGKLISFLESDIDKASVWAVVLGIETSDIAAYIGSLAPVILRSDTRVTNHGYSDGAATPRQSVLQVGTAVLVDDTGTPRVRCECGNPLLEPIPVDSGPNYVGDQWVGFDPGSITVIEPGAQVTVLVVISIETSQEIEIAVGNRAEPSGSPEPSESATASPSSSDSASASPSGTNASNPDYTSCARRYGELVRDLTLAGGIERSDAQRWSGQAEEAATKAEQGDLDGALAICEQTVSEMQAALDGS